MIESRSNEQCETASRGRHAAGRKQNSAKRCQNNGIPVEVWNCLGEEGIDMLWDLMQGIYEQEKIPTEWRDRAAKLRLLNFLSLFRDLQGGG